MPRLKIICNELPASEYELKLGVNRLGRSAKNDFSIDHPTVSAMHAEIVLKDGAVLVRDCDSTNGTYLDGEQIREAELRSGQSLHLGDVEMVLDTTEVTIAIPPVAQPEPGTPIPTKLPDGSLTCPNHPEIRAVYRCIECKQLLCDACIHKLRRRGGKTLLLCPLCSSACEPLFAPQPKRQSILEFLRKTLKLASKR